MIQGTVTALITRRLGDRVELCVFDHAEFVQLPSGTLDPEERPIAGVVRQAWHETGLPHLEVVGRVATLHDEHAGGTSRHVFHLRTVAPTPDEWWVLTPDGGGSQWRCRWVPVDEATGLQKHQRRWLDSGRDLLDPGPPVDPMPPNPPGATELFDAVNGIRMLMTVREAPPPPGAVLGSSYGVCVTADGDAVIVTQDAASGWGLPGGRPEPGETPEETLAREVGEEACARVVDREVLLTSEDQLFDGHRNVARHHFTPVYWARVELDEWRPAFEMTERRLVPLADLGDALGWEVPAHRRIHELAIDAEARRS